MFLDEAFIPNEIFDEAVTSLATETEWYPAVAAETVRVMVEVEELRRIAKLAAQDKHRRVDGGVMVPITWLVGQRIGY